MIQLPHLSIDRLAVNVGNRSQHTGLAMNHAMLYLMHMHTRVGTHMALSMTADIRLIK